MTFTVIPFINDSILEYLKLLDILFSLNSLNCVKAFPDIALECDSTVSVGVSTCRLKKLDKSI